MNQIQFKRYFLLALLLILNACTANIFSNEATTISNINSTPDQLKPSKTFVYECQNGYQYTVNIEGRMAWLFLPGQTIGLPKITSASGTKYSNGLSTFWTKGNEARLELGSEVHKDCINNRSKAIWEDAKLNGADFRAVGNEPGWHLEIMHDKELVFTSQYGQTTHIFSTSQRQIDPAARKTVYSAKEKGNSILITILGVTCQDTMSDESYESTVSIVLDDKSFKGCGKALH